MLFKPSCNFIQFDIFGCDVQGEPFEFSVGRGNPKAIDENISQNRAIQLSRTEGDSGDVDGD